MLALADRLHELETQHPRHVALAMLLAEQQPREGTQLPLYVTWQQAGIPRRTWYRWIAKKRLDARKVGRVLLARTADVARLVASMPEPGSQERASQDPDAKPTDDTAAAHLAAMEREGVLTPGEAAE